MLFHNEPIPRDGRIVGQITSGAYGHTLGAAIVLGYVPSRRNESPGEVPASGYEIEVTGRRFSASASVQPLYDPRALRVHAA